MNEVTFHVDAFEEYLEWQREDRKTLKKINALIKDIQRNGLLQGIGKPEFLKHLKAYSRRIDDVNRLIYTADENQNLHIIACKGHYT
ncbi:Txe/YoeB family addiction module toxin [Treponema primitia]|uniref:Txe/YoeB family addiction module toxin n=1 Tax=Treponema primitia TaxID=88058 RepID=UPI0002555195|nr:Txe/YoeB family addiction module toxin [Treponema primitia]